MVVHELHGVASDVALELKDALDYCILELGGEDFASQDPEFEHHRERRIFAIVILDAVAVHVLHEESKGLAGGTLVDDRRQSFADKEIASLFTLEDVLKVGRVV